MRPIQEHRVCHLLGTDVWRVERLAMPRPFFAWLGVKPRWIVATHFAHVPAKDVPAEFSSMQAALAFKRERDESERIRVARYRSHWVQIP